MRGFMSYQVLARKWRPKTFSEVVGQDHIVKTLQNSIKQDKIGHAYLFTGTRGVGKTTVARIFAKSIRCEQRDQNQNPCLACDSCKSIDEVSSLDYVEIDGASNNSVDNIRELIENTQYLPTSGKYKVYVVDEVHMLSTSAFNAFLKTLEEPPAHVIFIFATTDPHKLLGTVLSRCQRFDFHYVSNDVLITHLKRVAQREGVEFESELLFQILAKHARGSIRDSLSLLDQAISLSSGEKISEALLLQSLGLARLDAVNDILHAIMFGNVTEVLELFDQVVMQGVELKKFLGQLLDAVFDKIQDYKETEQVSKVELVWIYEVMLKESEWGLSSFDPVRALRFCLMKVASREELVGASKKKPQITPQIKERTEALPKPTNDPATFKDWEGFLRLVKEENKSLGLNLERSRLLTPATEGIKSLSVAYIEEDRFFYDMLADSPHRSALELLAKEYFSPNEEGFKFAITLISNKAKEEQGLYSAVEIEEEKRERNLKEKERSLLENRFIKEAQDIFGSKITKIIVNSEDEETP